MPEFAADQEFERAVGLYRAGRYASAAQICVGIVSVAPGHPGACTLLGVMALEQGRPAAAMPYLIRAAQAGEVKALAALATAWRALGRPDLAAAAARDAAAAAPQVAEYHYNLGNALADCGDAAGAESAYRAALERDPGLVNAHWNLALLLLRLGRYAEAWPEYEWRWRRPGAPLHYHAHVPAWDGSGFAGRTLLLHTEQGLGDAMQFGRYIPLVQARGGRVVLECPRPLLRLFAASFPDLELVERDQPVPPFDLQAALPSLPGLFATTVETVPAPIPYLRSPARQPAATDGGELRVGLTWSCSAPSSGRDVPAAALAPLLGLPGVRVHALQLGPAAGQLAGLPGAERVIDLAPRISDFADTAALVAELDLMISVDTSVVHLAGGMGRPVWVMLPHRADWRWLEERGDSPWYPTARLFRQPAPGDWESVVAAMGEALLRFRQPA
jgi:Flp pilus assembly protein TadD